jgi:hypothetical protein
MVGFYLNGGGLADRQNPEMQRRASEGLRDFGGF